MLVVHNFTPALPQRTASYSEAAYFDGEHCQHIADWEEQKRLKRIRKNACKAVENERRRNGRALFR